MDTVVVKVVGVDRIKSEMNFVRIVSAKDRFAYEVIELYLETFPLNQRHNRDEFIHLLENEPRFFCNAVLMNDSLVGFCNYWDLNNFIFTEHIAVEPPMRGHKLGEKMIHLIRDFTSKPLILEVEKEGQDEWSSRRVGFYKRLGFEILSDEYEQPPYRQEEPFLPLYLMSDQLDKVEKKIDEIKKTIYLAVYKIN